MVTTIMLRTKDLHCKPRRLVGYLKGSSLYIWLASPSQVSILTFQKFVHQINSMRRSAIIQKNGPLYFWKIQFSRVRHHSKRGHRWVGVQSIPHKERRDPQCSSSKRLRVVCKDTGSPSKGATYTWMVDDEAAVRVHFLRCVGLLNDWPAKGVLSLVIV
ncbi:hypothetical protein TNCV_5081981 [Trichonephila clavipes]|nr:hypothetical protein TNCV_5081981 [Trichonephila clavipes]